MYSSRAVGADDKEPTVWASDSHDINGCESLSVHVNLLPVLWHRQGDVGAVDTTWKRCEHVLKSSSLLNTHVISKNKSCTRIAGVLTVLAAVPGDPPLSSIFTQAYAPSHGDRAINKSAVASYC